MAKAKTKSRHNRPTKETKVYVHIKEVNWVLLLVMSIIFGWIGVDRFIMGKVFTGILKLITFGGLGLWWLIDIILIATKYEFEDIRYVE